MNVKGLFERQLVVGVGRVNGEGDEEINIISILYMHV
jgi:hypothetical protein